MVKRGLEIDGLKQSTRVNLLKYAKTYKCMPEVEKNDDEIPIDSFVAAREQSTKPDRWGSHSHYTTDQRGPVTANQHHQGGRDAGMVRFDESGIGHLRVEHLGRRFLRSLFLHGAFN